MAILLVSCVVKSLKPFYTKDTLAYDASLFGTWKDDKLRVWEVVPMLKYLDSTFVKKEKSSNGKTTISKNKDFIENKELQKVYKNACLFIKKAEKKEAEEAYIVVPFKIKGQLFLDFTPFEVKGLSDSAERHFVGIHTLAKVDRKGKDFKLSWLSEVVLQDLFEQKKIRISHEKIGIDKKDILLTASSEELQKFIEKYMKLDDKDKWDGVDLTFKRIK